MATYNQDIETLRKRLSILYTDTYRYVVTQKGLVKTGTLRDSIVVDVVLDQDGYTVNVSSVDYFDYLDERYDITTTVSMDKDIQKLGTDLLTAIIVSTLIGDTTSSI